MEFKHDAEADAIYISVNSKPYAYGKDLDDERRIDYAADNTPIGVELLYVGKGVNLDGLPHKDEIAQVLEAEGIKTYEMIKYAYTTSEDSSNIFNVRLGSLGTRERQEYTAGPKREVTV